MVYMVTVAFVVGFTVGAAVGAVVVARSMARMLVDSGLTVRQARIVSRDGDGK